MTTVAVSGWAILGIVLLLLALPMVLPAAGSLGHDFGYAVGAGAAFLIVGIAPSVGDWAAATHEEEREAARQ